MIDMEYLADITKTTILKEGAVRALAIYGKTMVLLFEMKEGATVETHHHPHAQMGYVFHGTFEFETPANRYDNIPGDAYIIKEKAPHKVIATSDFYSMDIKYMGTTGQLEEIKYDVLQEIERSKDYVLCEVVLDQNKVYKFVSYSAESRLAIHVCPFKKYCLAVSDKCEVVQANSSLPILLEPMRIYAYDPALGDITMKVLTEEVEIFIFEVK